MEVTCFGVPEVSDAPSIIRASAASLFRAWQNKDTCPLTPPESQIFTWTNSLKRLFRPLGPMPMPVSAISKKSHWGLSSSGSPHSEPEDETSPALPPQVQDLGFSTPSQHACSPMT